MAGQFDGQGDHNIPKPYVRQCVLSVPKRLCYFMQHDGAVSPGAAQVDNVALHIGAIAFIYRFGSGLNGHVHFMFA